MFTRYDSIEEMADALADLRAAEFPCRDCLAVAINGINCHEHGCPAARRIKDLAAAIERAEEA